MLPIPTPWRPFASAVDRRDAARLLASPRLEDAWCPALLRLAHDAHGAARARGIDGASPRVITPAALEAIAERVGAGRWQPAPLRSTFAGDREVGIPVIEDQLVVAAWRLWAEPRIDRRLLPHVYGFRRGHSVRGAIDRLVGRPGTQLVRTDIRKMFPSIPHARALDTAREALGPGLQAELLARALAAWSPKRGLPTGVAFSPALANLVCARWVDPVVAELGGAAVRYADDFALWLDSDGRAALRRLDTAVSAAGLELHPGKTRIHRASATADWPVVVLGHALIVRDGALARLPAGSASEVGRRRTPHLPPWARPLR